MDTVDEPVEPQDGLWSPPPPPPPSPETSSRLIAVVAIVAALAIASLFAVRAWNAARSSDASAKGGPYVMNPRNLQDRRNMNTHWHAALGVYDCDHWMGDSTGTGVWGWPAATRNGTPAWASNHTLYAGLHSHGDGVIHMEPATKSDAGTNATLGRYFDEGGWALSRDGFSFLGNTVHNGDACASGAGAVRWWVNGKEHTGDPARYKLYNDDVIVVAFTAHGDAYPGDPPSAANLPDAASRVTVPPAADATAPAKPCVGITGPLPEGAPTFTVPTGPPPARLVTRDLKVGTGPTVTPGATVTVNYVGVACSTGRVFDSSWARRQPATFPLDSVIPGWTDGLPGVRVGGRRLLGIPPADAYGSRGSPPVVGPNETLWFVVDVLSIDK